MHARPIAVVFFIAVSLLWPASAFAKRVPPTPVPPVVWQGIEYRAPLDHLGYVQAFETASGRMLWETEVYHVWFNPFMEEDVQWVFVSGMAVQDGKLLLRNEEGNVFRLDLATGQVEGTRLRRVLWVLGCAALIGLAILCRWAWRRRSRWMPHE